MEKIAVLGAGHGGFACAAKLALDGYKVHLYELPEFENNLDPIREAGGIEVEGEGKTGFAKLALATTVIEEAVDDVDMIEIIVPGFGQRRMSETCAPYLRDGQTVVFFGKGGGTLIFTNTLREKGIERDCLLGESSSIPPFSGRKSGPAKVNVSIILRHLPIASFPAKDVNKLVDTLKEIYPSVAPATNVLETILSDLNLVGHAAAALLNAGRIEYSGPFRLWREGVTPSVAKLIEAIDHERLAVMKALHLKQVETYVEMSKHWGMCPQDVMGYQEAINKKFIAPMDPTDLKTHRYISEDIPYSMVTCASIGDMIGVDTPIIKSVITLFSAINETDYWKEGRTVETLGISGLTLGQLKEYVTEGRIESLINSEKA